MIFVNIGFRGDISTGNNVWLSNKLKEFVPLGQAAHETDVQKFIVNRTLYNLNPGNKIRVRVIARRGFTTDVDYTATVKIKINSVFFNRVANNNIVEGNTLLLNNTIPRKIKLKDFFIWVIKMFNLYIEPDKDDSKKLNIEPRDDWYADGKTVDESILLTCGCSKS